jgi:amino acid transporter
MDTPVSDRGGRAPAGLHRAMGFRDVLLLLVTTTTNLQWVAMAAAGGASSILVWLIGAAVMLFPLAMCVAAMSSRHPDEGGIYVWTKVAFGDFAGFLTGWAYWMANLPYFPAVLYFAAGNLLYAGGDRWTALSGNASYFIGASLAGLAFATLVNLVGVEIGKWLSNVGAIARWLATLLLLVVGGVAWARFGSATDFSPHSLLPGTHLKDILFWSTIAFALTGLESASSLGGEIRNPTRTVPRALLASIPLILAVYIAGTVSVLVALPASQLSNLQGIMQAIEQAGRRIGVPGIAPVAAILITTTALGSVGAWLASVARIPFVAGIDRYLPAAFARVHRRWGTPWVALLSQSLITGVFVFLGQAGASVRGAYDALVSLTVIWYFIPYLFLFGAAIRLRGETAGAGFRIPGGPAALAVCGWVGIATTSGSIALSLLPSQNEEHPVLAAVKVVGATLLMLALGMAVYWKGRRTGLGLAPEAGAPRPEA